MFLCSMIISEALKMFDESLASLYPKQEADAIKYMVISDVLQTSKAKLHAFPDNQLGAPSVERLKNIITQLQAGIPVQYALGHADFYDLTFEVNPSVLIPRPETEELVQWVLDESRELSIKNQDPLHILDIGTGSGCIPITLKKHLPQAQVWAVDISPAALKTANKNAQTNEADVTFIEADILNPPATIRDSQYNIIISNPPYVTESEKLQMLPNVLDHEPHTALFVPDTDPLIFYRAIADFALQTLLPGGLLFFEINENLGKQTVELLHHKRFKNIALRQDMRGKDRMIKAER